jgi:hypothetical protein
MSDTNTNFWKAWHEFKWPDPEPVFYRIYYGDNGELICYTMEDLPGNYIEIDHATYQQGLPNIRIVDEKIKVINPSSVVRKLKPNKDQGTACHPSDICLVVSPTVAHTFWSMTSNETN